MTAKMAVNAARRKVVVVSGAAKLNSHYVWFQNTGYWPDYKNKQEVIHHLDGNPQNDDFSNLQLMTHREHMKIHHIKGLKIDGLIGRKRIQIDGKLKQYSHYIYFLNTGQWPDFEVKGEVIHHIDGNPLSNSFDNLQLMSKAEHDSFNKSGADNPMFDKRHSAETKRRMSDSQKGEKHFRWQDIATMEAKYHRHRRNPNEYPPLTEKERKERNDCQRRKYKERKENNK